MGGVLAVSHICSQLNRLWTFFKSENLKYNTLAHCFAGTNDLKTKRLMIQALKIANFETICIVNVWPLSGGIPVIMKETPYPN